MEEVWMPVVEDIDYTGLYEVSNKGNVRSLDRIIVDGKRTRLFKGKILAPQIRRDEYLCVNLSKNGVVKKYRVHRLVANAFIINPLGLPDINHKDENKQNNCVDNLEWCSRQYNLNYGTHNERMAKSKGVSIYQFNKNGDLIKEYPSIKDAVLAMGVSRTSLCKALYGKRHTCCGFIWKYKNDEIFGNALGTTAENPNKQRENSIPAEKIPLEITPKI